MSKHENLTADNNLDHGNPTHLGHRDESGQKPSTKRQRPLQNRLESAIKGMSRTPAETNKTTNCALATLQKYRIYTFDY